MNNERAKLSPAMIRALEVTGLDDIMAGGPTRAALMRRGLVSKRGGTGRFGHFTKDGRKLAAELQDEKERGHWSERAAEAEQELDTIEEEEMINRNRYESLADAMTEVDDLDAVTRAVEREREIRIGMARTGKGREVVAEFLDAQTVMTEEGVLELTDGQPTTLVDALTRYRDGLAATDPDENRIHVDDVVFDLGAILAFPWPEDERRVQLHNPHYGLALHITEEENRDLVIRMGNNRAEVYRVNWEDAGSGGQRECQLVAEAVYHATLARVIPDREHIVQLNAFQTADLAAWLAHPHGSMSDGKRLTLDVSGNGVMLRTRPYSHQSIPRNDG